MGWEPHEAIAGVTVGARTRREREMKANPIIGVRMLAVFLSLALSAAPAMAQASKSGGGPQEGIKVHGHWSIEVRDPDGSLVSHHEFENALVVGGGPSSGDALLAGLLAGTYGRVVNWSVQLVTNLSSLTGPCRFNGQPFSCQIVQGPGRNPPIFGGLLVRVPADAPGTLELSGQATVAGTDPIEVVTTDGEVCLGQECNFGQGFHFTRHVLSTPIQVAPGQNVNVTVRISFS